MSYRGGGRGGRSGNYRGSGSRSSGRSSGRGRGRSGGSGGQIHNIDGYKNIHPKLNLCHNFTNTNSTCTHGDNCYNSHSLMIHGVIQNASVKITNKNYQGTNSRHANLSSVQLWQQPPEAGGALKIFTGSSDGFWRLWNTSGGQFQKEFEHSMAPNGSEARIEYLKVDRNRLYVGFLGPSAALPTSVGMIHIWDLANPSQPPVELHLQPAPPLLPYAHNSAVTFIEIHHDDTSPPGPTPSPASPPIIITGAQDGSIRIWNNQTLQASLPGHAGGVTGLILSHDKKTLWSSGLDQTIRVWDTASLKCQHCITANNGGHSNAVTCMIKFQTPPPGGVHGSPQANAGAGGTFILSGSLDGTIKAWDASNGNCVASENCEQGVICMAIGHDTQQHPILLLGLENGDIMGRNLIQTAKSPAFETLFILTRYQSHLGACSSICTGPSSTFYTVGQSDGTLRVFQMGDLGI